MSPVRWRQHSDVDAAFEALVREMSASMIRTATFLTRDATGAKDVAQEALFCLIIAATPRMAKPPIVGAKTAPFPKRTSGERLEVTRTMNCFGKDTTQPRLDERGSIVIGVSPRTILDPTSQYQAWSEGLRRHKVASVGTEDSFMASDILTANF